MIDSGVLSGSDLAAELSNVITRAIAYQVGMPACIAPTSHLSKIEELKQQLGIAFPDTANFERFCEGASEGAPQLTKFSKQLDQARTAGLIQFPHPLYRHLKDHFAVRLYEIAKIFDPSRFTFGEVAIDEFVLDGCGFSTLTTLRSEGLLILGPVFLEGSVGEGANRAYFKHFEEALERFNKAIESFYCFRRKSEGSSESNLYTTEYLLRMAFSRKKLTVSAARHKFSLAQSFLERFNLLSFPEMQDAVPPNFFAKAVAAFAAVEVGGTPGSFHFKTFKNTAAVKIQTMWISDRECKLSSPADVPRNDDKFDFAYAAACEASFQNWNNFIAESLGQLRSWLTTGRVPSGDEEAGAASKVFGKRLARFLSSVFGAYECTIYRIIYTRNGRRMGSVGAFSADPYGDERLALMQSHMDSLLSKSDQNGSISFRCANENKVQYCQYFDYHEMKAIPEKQVITFPTHSRFKHWGTSACAVPIRVNGRLWGVAQLISNRPHAFPEVVRAKIEDACGIIGSHLFGTEMLDSIYNINHVIGDDDLPNDEKRSTIERALARMFGSKSFAIIRVDPHDLHRPVNVFLEVGRSDLRENAGNSTEYFFPFIEFSRGSEDIWHAMVGDEDFRRRFGTLAKKKFYENSRGDFVVLVRMNWELSAAEAIPGVVMLTYDHAMVEQENWQETIEFICQQVSTITGGLYNSDLWERRLREKLGHELSKTAHNLQTSISRLGEPRFRQDSSAVKHVIPAVVGDLGRHSKALERYVQILTKHRDISDFDNDPRLYIIGRLRSEYRTDKEKKGISLREAYNFAFTGQKERFDQKKIAFPRLEPSLDFWIDMDELCLREVLTTLVDNMVKYTLPDTAITLREESTDRFKGVVISNIGLRLDPDEVANIFDDEVRGRRARELLPTEGSGFGLWYAQKALHVWNCGLRHQQRELQQRELKERNVDYTWHDFTLGFLRRMVKDK